MRFAALLAFLLPFLSFGAVTIQPGQSITVEPDTRPTVVSCAPAGGAERPVRTGSTGAISSTSSSPVRTTTPGPSSGAFCYCRPLALQGSVDFNLIKVSLGANGERSETTLNNYVSGPACDKAISNYPSCR